MIDKRAASVEAAVSGIKDGDIVLVSGFGEAGFPFELIEGVLSTDAGDLTIVANNAGGGENDIALLIKEGRVSKVVCSYPRIAGSVWFEKRYLAGEIELELVPQGTLSERIRAGGAGIGGFLTPTGAGTLLAEGKETRELDGVLYVMEYPIRADVALIKADVADRWGNLMYRMAARNFAPTMAMAAEITVAQVTSIAEMGTLDPEKIMTPGVFVDHVVQVAEKPRVR
jgi:3-oxoadipate CoA-transferase, alpha subunit